MEYAVDLCEIAGGKDGETAEIWAWGSETVRWVFMNLCSKYSTVINYSLLSYPLPQAWHYLCNEFFPQLSGTQSEIYSKMRKKINYKCMSVQSRRIANRYKLGRLGQDELKLLI